ncbi:MAG: type II 3-dehydroquinate dehydratase [Parvibaculales bacterium]
MPKPVIFVLNGPNLNLLGEREPDIYGSTTLSDIETNLGKQAEKLGLSVSCFQTNEEGELVTLIQKAGKQASGLILNAGAYTHTSVALFDALQPLAIPVMEVHLSNIFRRESFRHHSFVSPASEAIICGLGADGYSIALKSLAKIIKKKG